MALEPARTPLIRVCKDRHTDDNKLCKSISYSGRNRLEADHDEHYEFGTIGGGTFGEMHIRALTQRARMGDVEFVGVADLKR